MISVGFNNFVDREKITAVVSVGDKYISLPVRRSIDNAKNKNKHIDMTRGKRTHTVIYTDSGYVVTVHISANTIIKRIQEHDNCFQEVEL